jgi:hypothetical protein
LGQAYTKNKDKKSRAGLRPRGISRSSRDRGRVEKEKDSLHIVNNFNILFTTADTFTQTKLQELKLRIEDTPPSIIVISEVKPKNFTWTPI